MTKYVTARTMNATAVNVVARESCSDKPSRPRYADSARPPIVPESPSVFVVCADISAMSAIQAAINAYCTIPSRTGCWSPIVSGANRLLPGSAGSGFGVGTAAGAAVALAAANNIEAKLSMSGGFVRSGERPCPMRASVRPKHEPDSGANLVVIRQHRAAVEFARALSTIFNPFVNATALFIIVSHAYSKSTGQFWVLSAVGAFFFCVAPLVCVLCLYVAGAISDFDITDRAERLRVFMAFVVIYLLAAIVLTLMRAPLPLIAITWGYWATALATMAITRWWKVSTHAFGIAGPFAVMFVLFKWQPLPYVALVPLVCWARVYLRAHTIAQVVAGAALAAASTIIFFKLFHLL